MNGGGPKVGDALAGELWELKEERIRKASVYGKLPGWDLRSVSCYLVFSSFNNHIFYMIIFCWGLGVIFESLNFGYLVCQFDLLNNMDLLLSVVC